MANLAFVTEKLTKDFNRMIKVFTDGGCHPNPGPGGWGVVIVEEGKPNVELYGGERDTTNNRMEMTAFLKGLEAIGPERRHVLITTDSQYVKNGITSWIHGWKRRGWVTADGSPVKNQDLWIKIDEVAQRHKLTVEWVKGHTGHVENERCDVLATKGRKELA